MVLSRCLNLDRGVVLLVCGVLVVAGIPAAGRGEAVREQCRGAPRMGRARPGAKALEKVRGVEDVACGVVLAGDSLKIKVDRERAKLLDLDPEEVTHLLTTAAEGEVPTSLQRDENLC